MILGRIAAALSVAVWLAGAAMAQSPLVLSLDGKVKQPRHWTMDDLRKLPAQHVDVTYQSERGPVSASFVGVPLWSLIETAGIDDDAKGALIRHAVRITASDGWVVVTSTGELAPDFGAKQALVAYERDGKPLADFRIVMPGDKHGGRYARDVLTISVE
jgi:DMSO/TMAO reductase YedYZ molybdopterin-dependent catalytic subunit